MAKYTYLNGNDYSSAFPTLANILDESGYFDTVTYNPSGTISIDCSINGNLVFRYSCPTFYNIKVLGVVPSFESSITSSSQYRYWPIGVYECDGGISIICSRSRILITKNQRDETVIVFTTNASNGGQEYQTLDANMSTLGAIAYTDGGTFRSYSANIQTFTQTLPIPICTCAALDTQSYTTTALFATYKQYTNTGFLTYNGKRYFFDGYFMIEDAKD